ncbi:HIT family protein [Sphaerisporangium rubeum]|uniref:Diadenosine tetraphosphate (Ap4A) HIT family hydrolase n=1 Tax=Sphaerisporangium rubeum TaxID=321317 RepID=A0A7X0IAE6_9ACTN|nr:HIT family protein [Sphaerisporangium rubeum]MBB6471599.1 diadenosine tetraphosphate (Ap4A) HIT family hydrolase [Sphaerisporangium rubeum]
MEHSGDGCVFCEVASGTAEVSLVWQDDGLMVVMDSHPVNPGHTLVVVRRHGSSLEDLDDQLGARLWCTARRVARGLRRCGLRCDAVNMLLEDVEGSHAHMHVFPRFADDDFVIDADCEPRERRLLDREAWLLREAMSSIGPRLPIRG